MGDLSFPVLYETAAAWEMQSTLARFRRALRRRDQHVLDDLLGLFPWQVGAVVPREMEIEAALLAALLGEQKELIGIQEALLELAARQIGDG
jgi:hypothetical protein